MPQKKNVETKLNFQDHKTAAREKCGKFTPQQKLTCGQNEKVRYQLCWVFFTFCCNLFTILQRRCIVTQLETLIYQTSISDCILRTAYTYIVRDAALLGADKPFKVRKWQVMLLLYSLVWAFRSSFKTCQLPQVVWCTCFAE